jgi:hypothetical protein
MIFTDLSEDEVLSVFSFLDFEDVMSNCVYVSHQFLDFCSEFVQISKISRSNSFNTSDKLVYQICSTFPKIRSLDLSSSPLISFKSLKYLSMFHSETLISIDISFCSKHMFDDYSFFFKECKLLETIILDHMPVNSKLIDTISENNKNLKELRIYYGGTVSEESILNLIQRIPLLEVLDFTNIDITETIIKQLATLKELRTLILDEIENVSTSGIIEIIKSCKNLKLLSLQEVESVDQWKIQGECPKTLKLIF